MSGRPCILVAPALRPLLVRHRRRLPAKRAAGPVRVQALGMGWVAAGAAAVGLLLGLVLAKAAQSYFISKEFDPNRVSSENAQLRAKVDELQQMVLSYEPMAYKRLRLRFTKGINKAVILGLVDELLGRKEVNVWWIPDSIERIFYFNIISLLLSVMDEMVDGVSMNVAGHNVKLQLTYLDLETEGPEGKPQVPAKGGPGGLVPAT